jgi:hypothetical protein
MVNRRLKARRLDLKASVTESLDDDLGRVFGVKDLRREIATASRSKIGLTSAPRRTAAQDGTAGHNPASPENLIFLDRGCLDKDTKSNEAIAVSRITQNDQIGLLDPRGGDMRLVTGVLASVLLLAGVGASHAVVRIADDHGGRIGTYVDRYQGLRSSGETVVIDGLCASACTIVLNAVPHDKICVTSRATLGFHAAWNFGAKGRTITDREATLMLYSMYPMPVQRWIAARGGLTPHMIFLRGKVLQAMYKPCYIDAHYAGF